MIGVYLSGTGNTEHCIKKLVSLLDPPAITIPLESERVITEIIRNDIVVLGYPTQYSNAPYMVRNFISKNASLWKNKKIFCMATMGAFSGDGAGCTARILKKHGAVILGGLHIRMPDSVCDSKLLKKTKEQNKQILLNADRKIEQAAAMIREGNYPREGITFLSHLAGLFGQRLWFYGKTKGYSDRLKISSACIGCGICSSLCPMKNLSIVNGKAIPAGKCTMCYRCISSCPKQAITLLGTSVQEQCRYENYI
ncbi:EFR1 family ferrodoxin [Qiania dongpingensis]|uniref:Iron-sulfur protein n=1 Tax=Qiania dongpingensis TaxID=2763669 RepID=A0A7G9G2Y2_9FIRM|nr:EFR1 family ferrodoxin [Qiania dongpingensis]QNM05164.1 iron-sulfur protein [Qiania dongpingensis]